MLTLMSHPQPLMDEQLTPFEQAHADFHSKLKSQLDSDEFTHFNQSTPQTVSMIAASHGNLKLIQWLHSPGNEYSSSPPSVEIVYNAAINGHIHVIQWAFSNGVPPSDATRACTYAAANGQLRCLKYLKKCGVDWDASVCSFAAMKGHLDILQYAKSKNCPCSSQASAWAGANGHFEVLKWLYDNWWATGPVWDEETFAIITSSKLPRSFNRPPIGIDKKESDQSPKDQSPKTHQSSSITLDILKWMHEKKCPIDARAAQWALESLNTLVLQWLVTINDACHRVVRTYKVPPTFQSHPNLLALIKSLQ